MKSGVITAGIVGLLTLAGETDRILPNPQAVQHVPETARNGSASSLETDIDRMADSIADIGGSYFNQTRSESREYYELYQKRWMREDYEGFTTLLYLNLWKLPEEAQAAILAQAQPLAEKLNPGASFWTDLIQEAYAVAGYCVQDNAHGPAMQHIDLARKIALQHGIDSIPFEQCLIEDIYSSAKDLMLEPAAARALAVDGSYRIEDIERNIPTIAIGYVTFARELAKSRSVDVTPFERSLMRAIYARTKQLMDTIDYETARPLITFGIAFTHENGLSSYSQKFHTLAEQLPAQ